jgi:hypothetical protein
MIAGSLFSLQRHYSQTYALTSLTYTIISLEDFWIIGSAPSISDLVPSVLNFYKLPGDTDAAGWVNTFWKPLIWRIIVYSDRAEPKELAI